MADPTTPTTTTRPARSTQPGQLADELERAAGVLEAEADDLERTWARGLPPTPRITRAIAVKRATALVLREGALWVDRAPTSGEGQARLALARAVLQDARHG